MSRKGLEGILKEPSEFKRKILLLGYLVDKLSRNKVEAVIVGGQAVEIYTAGQHTTGDVDLAVSDRGKTEKVLRKLGFRQEGRVWIHLEWNIAVDIVASSLVEVEDKNRIRRFKAGPFTLNLYGLEDLIVQRLCSAKYWHYPEDLEQAATLLAAHKDRIDTQYLQRKAEKEKVDDLLQKIKEKLRL
ncbi:MAG: hypothetical protein AYL30_006220 [Candidatus Hecatellales archaeon B24]|nr:MAG: hypothetical protein AYL30_006220 [Candidatus Hecatellales archaeon B24]